MPRGINDYDTAELQGRNVANANSVNIVSPGLITDGLTLHLDAGNFVSYPAAGSTLQDLSGNQINGTLINGPTFERADGGSLRFTNPSTQYITLGVPALLNQAQVPLTICAWVKAATTPPSSRTIWGVYKSTSNSELYSLFRIDSGVLKYYASTSGGGFQSQGTFTLSVDIWYFCSVTIAGSISAPFVTIYRNDSSESFNYSALSSSPSSSVDFRIAGTQQVINETWDGNIALMYLYKRALSKQEINQNFNATKARFGV